MAYTVTVLDAASIQSYIFGSNELRENIGASELVYRATRLWAFEALRDVPNLRHNIDIGAAQADAVNVYVDGFHIEDTSDPAAEVLYAGGGNTVILFGGEGHADTAKEFVYRLSRRVLLEAPGLKLYAAHKRVDSLDKAETLIDAIDAVFRQHLPRLKDQLPGPTPLLGLSVTAACTSTGLPASEYHNPTHYHKEDEEREPDRIVSNEVIAKWQAARNDKEDEKPDAEKSATQRLRGLFQQVLRNYPVGDFEWSDDLNKIGNLGRNESYIAVVHADGNGMGARIQALQRKFKDEPARDYIAAMRRLSISLQETARNALCEIFDGLAAKLADSNDDDNLYCSEYDEKLKKKRRYFPFRPIVFGGDDVTWVCAGPWGLALAQRYLAALEAQALDDSINNDPPYACAGVTIVKTHYPFSRAYDMSEDLLKSAKMRVRELRSDKLASGLDWHVTTTGLSGDLDETRRREYTVDAGSLLMRPLVFTGVDEWRTWDNFHTLLVTFRDHWADQRNKVHRLREALRGNQHDVQQFETIYLSRETDPKKQLPVLQHMPDGHKYGWVEEEDPDKPGELLYYCLYFDAIEMHDQFFDLT